MVHAALKTYALALVAGAAVSAGEDWCSPAALVATRDGSTLYAGCGTAARVEILDAKLGAAVRNIPTPGPVSGLALSVDSSRLFITFTGARDGVLTWPSGKTFAAGHGATSPVLSRDGRLLYVCNRFDDDDSVIDTASGRTVARIPVAREPVSAALSADGAWLLVANSLPSGRSDVPPVAAEISLVNTAQKKVAGRIALPNGSTGVREIRISPDGRRAVVTHVLGHYLAPCTQIDRGWIETNAISILDVAGQKLAGTVLLDEIDRGAANPWAVAWSADGKSVVITHAGTHEVSVIDWPGLEKKLAGTTHDPADDLAFLVGLRRRVRLSGNGPRAIAVADNRAWGRRLLLRYRRIHRFGCASGAGGGHPAFASGRDDRPQR